MGHGGGDDGFAAREPRFERNESPEASRRLVRDDLLAPGAVANGGSRKAAADGRGTGANAKGGFVGADGMAGKLLPRQLRVLPASSSGLVLSGAYVLFSVSFSILPLRLCA